MADNTCPHNDVINCPPNKRHCSTCSWSPDGVKRRVEKKVRNPQQGPTRSKRVAKVDAHGRVVEIYSSINMAAQQNDVSRTTVRQRCDGVTTRFDIYLDGCTFKYID